MRRVSLTLKTPTTRGEFEAFEHILHDFMHCITIHNGIGNPTKYVNIKDRIIDSITGYIWNESEFVKYSSMFNIIYEIGE